jgi:hypothetical protein
MFDPTRLVSLWDMLRTYCGFLGHSLLMLRGYEMLFGQDNDKNPAATLGEAYVAEISQLLDTVAKHGRLVELTGSVTLALHIKHELEPRTKAGTAAGLMREMYRRVHHELCEREFLYVPSRLASHYNEPLEAWGLVPVRFRKCAPDIVEAEYCFALSRPTATVFHLMRVAEIGLRVLAWDRRVILRGKAGRVLRTPLDLVTWDKILVGLEKAETAIEDFRKTPAREAQLAFYHGAMIEVRAFKNLYRNRVMHTRESYKMHQAESAMNHVRDFMTTLATRLAEDVRTPVVWTKEQLKEVA